jgi:hypothetical protein
MSAILRTYLIVLIALSLQVNLFKFEFISCFCSWLERLLHRVETNSSVICEPEF